MATFRDFPWRKVPAYIFGQVMGGVCGAGIVYANYIHAIDLVEGGRHIRTVPGTAALFSTYAVGRRGSLAGLIFAHIPVDVARLHDLGLMFLRRGMFVNTCEGVHQ